MNADCGDKKQCANCKAVGLECIFTDKLARKAFPRGYTESLEERVRELEYDNKKLQKLLSLKNSEDTQALNGKNIGTSVTVKEEPLDDITMEDDSNGALGENAVNNGRVTEMRSGQLLPGNSTRIRSETDAKSAHLSCQSNVGNLDSATSSSYSPHSQNPHANQKTSTLGSNSNVTLKSDSGPNPNPSLRPNSGLDSRSTSPHPINALNLENISRLETDDKLNLHTHDENCNCGMHHSVINRPVSIAGSVDIDHGDLSDDDSLYSADSYYARQHLQQLNHNIKDNNFNNNNYTSPTGVDTFNHFHPGGYNNNDNHLNFPNGSSDMNQNSDFALINGNYNNNSNGNYNNNNGLPSTFRTEKMDSDKNAKNRFVYNPNSFEQVNAPGAAAALSLQNKLRTKNFLNLANLIAASIPRSTEETLFIPTLLARVIKTHGFDSKAPYLTARSIALLKQAYNEENRYSLFPITFSGVNFNDLSKNESKKFFQSLNLPNNINLDICITIFFNTWNTIIPILNKEIFMSNYKKFIKSRDLNYEDGELIGFEKFGELLVIITCLVMISNERNNISNKFSNTEILESIDNNKNNDSNEGTDKKISSNSEILQFYDHLIKQLIQSNMSSSCSISSLQIITIELLYCLTTDDLTTSYELRGRMITMCQQLRLHRCPAAVLGSNGSSVSKLQQGERRILFWCIYTLDSFSAFILGVPRLLKDYEVECALPSSSSDSGDKESDISLITFKNNIQLSLVGKVCDSALSVMRYSKILGTIVDSIFKRNEGLKQTNINESKCLIMEDLLETWKRNLPSSISFDSISSSKNVNSIDNLNETQLTLYYLYYQAKALIYMPLLATESNNSLTSSKCSPAFISIQQATTSILTTMKVLNSKKHNYYFLPLPINIARQMARFSLLAAKNSLEYTRGGSLFQEAKLLLSCIINELKIENKIGLLGCLSNNCINCLEHAIDAILSQPKPNNLQSSLDPIKSIKKDIKKENIGSPLKIVSKLPAKNKTVINDENAEHKNSKDGRSNRGTKSQDEFFIKNDSEDALMDTKSATAEDEYTNTASNKKKNLKRESALNDIFANDDEKDKGKTNDEHNVEGDRDELFKFMSEDPKEMEEESLNMILKNVDGVGSNSEEMELERQRLLIKQKQEFLQAQQDTLQKQIQLLQTQAKAQELANERAQLLSQSESQIRTQSQLMAGQMQVQNRSLMQPPIQLQTQGRNPVEVRSPPMGARSTALPYKNMNFPADNSNKSNANHSHNFANGHNPNPNPSYSANTNGVGGLNMSYSNSSNTSVSSNNNANNNSNLSDSGFGVKSFSDLLMLNDFGVDASLGLPLLDFEFDTSQSKKQKLDTNFTGASNASERSLYGYDSMNMQMSTTPGIGMGNGYNSFPHDGRASYDNYNGAGQFKHEHEHQHRANYGSNLAEGPVNPAAPEQAKDGSDPGSVRNISNSNSNSMSSLFNWNL